MKRILAIGDIHGSLGALETLLAAVAPGPEDLVVTLGDYIDRGPDSRGVLDRLLGLARTTRLVAIRGNHEWMMMESRRNRSDQRMWINCGGAETLDSYGGTLSQVPAAHWEFMDRTCVLWHEIETHFFVHGMADPDLPLAEQNEYRLYWQPVVDPRPHVSGKVIVCGHTEQRSGEPLNLGHTICIDTWAYGNGWLTCLDVVSGQVWQANRRGDVRTAHIDDYAANPEAPERERGG